MTFQHHTFLFSRTPYDTMGFANRCANPLRTGAEKTHPSIKKKKNDPRGQKPKASAVPGITLTGLARKQYEDQHGISTACKQHEDHHHLRISNSSLHRGSDRSPTPAARAESCIRRWKHHQLSTFPNPPQPPQSQKPQHITVV